LDLILTIYPPLFHFPKEGFKKKVRKKRIEEYYFKAFLLIKRRPNFCGKWGSTFLGIFQTYFRRDWPRRVGLIPLRWEELIEKGKEEG